MWYDLRKFMTGKNFKITAEIVNGICPTCDEYTPLVGITKQYFRCLTCVISCRGRFKNKISQISMAKSVKLKGSLHTIVKNEKKAKKIQPTGG